MSDDLKQKIKNWRADVKYWGRSPDGDCDTLEGFLHEAMDHIRQLEKEAKIGRLALTLSSFDWYVIGSLLATHTFDYAQGTQISSVLGNIRQEVERVEKVTDVRNGE